MYDPPFALIMIMIQQGRRKVNDNTIRLLKRKAANGMQGAVIRMRGDKELTQAIADDIE